MSDNKKSKPYSRPVMSISVPHAERERFFDKLKDLVGKFELIGTSMNQSLFFRTVVMNSSVMTIGDEEYLVVKIKKGD